MSDTFGLVNFINQLIIGEEMKQFFFVGTLAQLRKANIGFVMPVGPSVRMEQLGSHSREFNEI